MSILEWVAALCIIISVIMLSKGMSHGWTFSVIGCTLYGILFLEQKLYANLVVQIIFIIQGLHGLYVWNKQQETEKNFLCKPMNNHVFLLISVICLVGSFLTGLLMYLFTDNSSAFIDSILSGFSLLAAVLMTKKYIQSWFIWMTIDVGYIFLFASVEMWISSILYLMLFSICINGFLNWRKQLI